MTDEPTTRASLAKQAFDWLTHIETVWQVAIILTLGASVLLATLLYQHPEWITMILQARLGGSQ